MKRKLGLAIAIVTSLVMVLLPASPAFAATSADVVITAQPAFVGVTNAPATWLLNGINLTGVIEPDTIYYANPGTGDNTSPSATVTAAECYFTLTNTSTVDIDVNVTCGNFTGGGADMTNSNSGANGATTYGAYAWYSSMNYSLKVIMKCTGSDDLITSHSGNLDWGAEIETQTDAWSSGDNSTTNMTINATASY